MIKKISGFHIDLPLAHHDEAPGGGGTTPLQKGGSPAPKNSASIIEHSNRVAAAASNANNSTINVTQGDVHFHGTASNDQVQQIIRDENADLLRKIRTVSDQEQLKSLAYT